MERTPSPLLKFFVSFLTTIFFLTNVAFAYKPEANFWAERRNAVEAEGRHSVASRPQNDIIKLASLPISLQSSAQILNTLPSPSALSPALSRSLEESLPRDSWNQVGSLVGAIPGMYGTVRTAEVPSGHRTGRIILHIQDIHMNPEAQTNISRTLQELIHQKKVDLIALEGAFDPIDLSLVRSFPDKTVTQHVADYLLKHQEISGPIYAALTAHEEIPPVVGIDDRTHYNANVEAYQRSYSSIEGHKGNLSKHQFELQEKKKTTFNADLASFDQAVENYRSGHIKVGEYLKVLVRHAGASSDIQSFLQALSMEERMNFTQVEEERSHLLSQLVKTLDSSQITSLLKESVAYRLGTVSHTGFYSYLKDLCQHQGISLNHYPSLNTYVQYVLLSDRLDPEKLLLGLGRMEKEGYRSLVKTPQEKVLIEESKHLYLVGKLLDFSLTTEEWTEYKTSIKDNAFSSFESFYKEAETRNDSITQNLLKAMDKTHAQVAVLVTGGFHTDGLKERLSKAGMTLLSFTPKITHVDTEGTSTYLNVFMQQKTPLSSLFQGEKLFVAPRPTADPAEMGALIATEAARIAPENAAEAFRAAMNEELPQEAGQASLVSASREEVIARIGAAQVTEEGTEAGGD